MVDISGVFWVNDPSAAPASGAQTISRAFTVLRLIARRGITGMQLTEVAAAIDLPHPTAHRLLRALVQQGAVEQDRATRRYKLGQAAFELSLASSYSGRFLADRYRPMLQRLNAATEDTVYLVLRSGFDAICVDRVEARTSVRIVTLDIGEWRPLGVGAAGTALLAALPDAEAEACLAANSTEYERYRGLTEREVRARVKLARQDGFGSTKYNLPVGTSAVGVALPLPGGVPYLGISIGSLDERITSRLKMLKRLLRAEIEQMSQTASDAGPGAAMSKSAPTGQIDPT